MLLIFLLKILIHFLYFILQNEEAKGRTAAASSPETGHPEASESSPPVKKSAMAELFGELFKTQVGNNKDTLQLVKEEVAAYKAVSCISVDSDPLLWWKGNEAKYPLTAKLARRYLAIPATSVPSERVFSTAGDIVTASRSALTADNVDKLIFLAENMKVE